MAFKTGPLEYARDMLFSIDKVDKVSIAGLLVLAQLFVLLSSPYLWENEAIKDMFLMYFVMMGFSYAVLDSENPFYDITLWDGLTQLSLAFVGGVLLFSQMGFAGSVNLGGFGSLTLLIIAQSLVVGTVEESLFRGAIPKALDRGKMNPNISRLISAVAFSLFHCWVYNFNLQLLFAAFLFAVVMQYIWDGGSVDSDRAGYPLVACGLHSAYNTVVLAGAFSLWPVDILSMIGGVV